MQNKILIVDDDENICELLNLYLKKDGFDTSIAYNGRQAVELAEKYNPDLILLDIMLPELDGWQVCREIRKKSEVPIIMLTAKGETFDKILGLELGADDYVTKPFDTKEVVARIKAVLRRSNDNEKTEKKIFRRNLFLPLMRSKLQTVTVLKKSFSTEIIWSLLPITLN